jgi:hypothetical protein
MCEKGCALFRGVDLQDATHCPVCKSPRYRDDTIGEKIPCKVKILSSSPTLDI